MISFVIPVYNAQETIVEVAKQVISLCVKNSFEYEVILIDDGSKDSSWRKILELSESNPKIIGLQHAKNFGQHNAIMTGLKACEGDYIVLLDDDLQILPEDSIRLIDKLKMGHDVVYAHYIVKKHSLFRRFGSWLNSLMAEILIGKTRGISITSFFAIKRFIRDEIVKYRGTYVYLPGLIFRCTQDVVNVETSHHSRKVGESNYNLVNLTALWINGFTNFSIKPLRVLTLTGFMLSFFAFIYSIFVIAKKIESPEIPLGWATIAVFLVMFGGLNMMAIGLVGEYVGRAYLLLNNHPQSVVRRTSKHVEQK